VKDEYIYAVAEDSIYPVLEAEKVCGKDKSRLEALCLGMPGNQGLKPEERVSHELFDVTQMFKAYSLNQQECTCFFLEYPSSRFMTYCSTSSVPREVPGMEKEGMRAWCFLQKQHFKT
jgi:hypothetical protein